MKQKIYVDGSGDGRFCWYNETRNTSRAYKEVGITNNQAEYLAVYNALLENEAELEILSDSKLVVNQLNRNWHIKDDKLRKLFDKVQQVIKKKNLKVVIRWIKRKENKAGKYLG
ncbi:MAG: reverse transcriptase-like protein [Candidatus Aenigmarchaeota archaeon]|nr:reverse transcriptase-like protein [Candidatus Aenigmarchaeota archaeon]